MSADQQQPEATEQPAITYQRLRQSLAESERLMKQLAASMPELHQRHFFEALQQLHSHVRLQAIAQENEFPALHSYSPGTCPGLIFMDEQLGAWKRGCGNTPAQGSRLCLRCIADSAKYAGSIVK